MTLLPNPDRRRAYWDAKYLNPHWSEDIHFGLYSGGREASVNLDRGVNFNTANTISWLRDSMSVYRADSELYALDFGCGAGDLLLYLNTVVPRLKAVGIDISHTAVELATTRAERSGSRNVQFQQGGIESLEAVLSSWQKLDLVVCRDVMYLLYGDERARFWRAVREVLRPGGLVYIADLLCEPAAAEALQEHLVDRQHGGGVTQIVRPSGGNTFTCDIEEAADNCGLTLVKKELDEEAVALSYLAASEVAAPDVRPVYQRLAAVAAAVNGSSGVPYGRFLFRCRQTVSLHWKHNLLGISLSRDWCFRKKSVLQRGEFLFPAGAWSLIVGRSGSGKTTLLKLIAGELSGKGVRRVNLPPRSPAFLLPQQPLLIGDLTARENVQLLARNAKEAAYAQQHVGLSDALMSQAVRTLSGGEAQRVALAQALAAKADLLFLDEPCTGVDRPQKRHFFQSLRSADHVNSETSQTVLCVDHEFVDLDVHFPFVFELLGGELYCMKTGENAS